MSEDSHPRSLQPTSASGPGDPTTHLTTEPPSEDNIADDLSKVNVVSSDFKEHPATTTSVQDVPVQPAPYPVSGGIPPTHTTSGGHAAPEPSRGQRAADKAKKYVHDAEEEGFYLWNVAKHHLLRPGVAGGLIGVGASLQTREARMRLT